jgi:hypothetical protein
MFQGIMMPSPLRSSRPRKKKKLPALLDPEDEGTKIFQNVKRYSLLDTASQSTRLDS